jgi:hypothetical protein
MLVMRGSGGVSGEAECGCGVDDSRCDRAVGVLIGNALPTTGDQIVAGAFRTCERCSQPTAIAPRWKGDGPRQRLLRDLQPFLIPIATRNQATVRRAKEATTGAMPSERTVPTRRTPGGSKPFIMLIAMQPLAIAKTKLQRAEKTAPSVRLLIKENTLPLDTYPT